LAARVLEFAFVIPAPLSAPVRAVRSATQLSPFVRAVVRLRSFVSDAFMRFPGYHPVYIVFVESFCRTSTLSLTGLLLWPFVNRFVVMWKSLADKYSATTLKSNIV
jgi:hypothetical protein